MHTKQTGWNCFGWFVRLLWKLHTDYLISWRLGKFPHKKIAEKLCHKNFVPKPRKVIWRKLLSYDSWYSDVWYCDLRTCLYISWKKCTICLHLVETNLGKKAKPSISLCPYHIIKPSWMIKKDFLSNSSGQVIGHKFLGQLCSCFTFMLVSGGHN